MDTLGDRIFAVRDAMPRGGRLAVLSREAFAALLSERLGGSVSAGAVADWEKGRTEPSLAVLAALAAMDPLERGRDWLTYGDPVRVSGIAETHGAPVESFERPAEPPPTTGRGEARDDDDGRAHDGGAKRRKRAG